jgi:hypothetical protein
MLFKNRGISLGFLGNFTANISVSQAEMNLASWAINNGWDGIANSTITIDSGVYVYSNNASVPALSTGVFPGGLKLIINGFVLGKGGDGGGFTGEAIGTAVSGGNGGTAIKLECNTTISGAVGAYIGGGGGGGSYAYATNNTIKASGGGGAGGGKGGNMISTTNGGNGGEPGQSGANGVIRTTSTSNTSAGTFGRGGSAGGSASNSSDW